MLDLLKRFVAGGRGESVAWIVVVIVGVIIAVAAFLKLKDSPGTLGNAIPAAAQNAAQGLSQVRVQ